MSLVHPQTANLPPLPEIQAQDDHLLVRPAAVRDEPAAWRTQFLEPVLCPQRADACTRHPSRCNWQARRRRLANGWRQSPYFLELPKPKPVGVDAEMERYSDRYRRKPQVRLLFGVCLRRSVVIFASPSTAHSRVPPQTERVPLASVMTLIPKYYPPELYVRRVGPQRAQPAAEASWNQAEGTAGDDLMRLEKLMARTGAPPVYARAGRMGLRAKAHRADLGRAEEETTWWGGNACRP